MNSTLDDPTAKLLDALGDSVRRQGKGWIARCPNHDDRHASLTITTADDGKVLMKCQAGCETKDVLGKLGLQLRDLFPARNNGNGHAPKSGGRISKTYDYINGDGELIYQKVRYIPKRFSQRRPDGKGGWTWNMEGIERVLYHLPQLLNSADDRPEDWVFISESEKDIDNLAAANLIATCADSGAGKWEGEDGDRYAEILRRRKLVILPHNDDAGREHAQDVARSCHGKAADIRIVELPNLPLKGDVSDWIQAGGTAEQLLTMAEAAPKWKPEDAKTTPDPMSVRRLMASFPHLRPPVVHGLLRRGETMNVIAPPKTGKSWLVIDLAIALATGRMWLGKFQTEPGEVLILDNELHGETCAARIPKVATARGVLVDEFADHIFVENLRGRLRDVFTLAPYFNAIQPGRFKAIVLDAFYRFLPADSDENSNATMAGIYSHLDQYADRLGCCFILIHHSTKGSQAEKSVTDVGAGAGSQSRATDTHLILRQHEENGVVVLDAAVRSWAPLDPLCLRWDFPVWTADSTLDPNKLRRAGIQRKRVEEQPEKPEPVTYTPSTFAATFIQTDPKTEAALLVDTSTAGLSDRRAKQFLAVAIERGIVHRWTFGNRRTPHKFASVAQPVTLTSEGGANE